MKTLKRIGTTIISSFESVVSQVENHEAVVNCAIAEIQESGTKAKVQLNRVRQDGQRMRNKLIELKEQLELWQQRAKLSAQLDQQKAIECLRRKRKIEKAIADTEIQERQHASFEKQLASDLLVIDDKLSKLKQQRNILRTRQSRADAMRLLQSDQFLLAGEIDDVLERWEIRVGQYETQSSALAEHADPLETDFSMQEEESSLKAELENLISQSN